MVHSSSGMGWDGSLLIFQPNVMLWLHQKRKKLNKSLQWSVSINLHIGRSNAFVTFSKTKLFFICLHLMFLLYALHWLSRFWALAEKQESVWVEVAPQRWAEMPSLRLPSPLKRQSFGTLPLEAWWLTDSLKSWLKSNQLCTQTDWSSTFFVL